MSSPRPTLGGVLLVLAAVAVVSQLLGVSPATVGWTIVGLLAVGLVALVVSGRSDDRTGG